LLLSLAEDIVKGDDVGVYLCVFDGDDEVDGVEIGHYSDFGELRDYVVRELKGGGEPAAGFRRLFFTLTVMVSGPSPSATGCARNWWR
jgi:hypothetical protein